MVTSPTKRLRSGVQAPAENTGASYFGEKIEGGSGEFSAGSHHGKMEAQILLAAIALFAERGFENCSMRALAEASGLKAPTLYNYFSSKEAVLVEAMTFGMDDFFGFVLQDIDEVPREKRLFAILQRHAVYKMRRRIISRANDRLIDTQFSKIFLPQKVAEKFNEQLKAYRHLVQELVEEYLSPEDPINPKIITLTILTQCDRLAYWYEPDGLLDQNAILDQMTILTRRILGIESHESNPA
ncbi:MAG: TetR family transcriptional regulator protein [Pseudomonas sp.]|nr:TetR family transcriptional regulator protein [Pseudomonas sp.]